MPAKHDDILELDEVWSFVFVKTAKYWLWTALCRRTRQIVAFVIGDHSAETCQCLWNKIPKEYRTCHAFSDFWDAYQKVFPEETHRSVGKDSGETNHMERWNCTLRQRLARYVRKTLSFSKVEYMHPLVTRWFIVESTWRLFTIMYFEPLPNSRHSLLREIRVENYRLLCNHYRFFNMVVSF